MTSRWIAFSFVASAMIACGSSTTPADGSATDAVADTSTIAPDASSASDAGAAPDREDPPAQDSGAASDGSNPFADAGALGEPAWVPITVLTAGTCPAITACGGNIVGTWDVSAACIEVPIEQALALCPGAMITRREGRARGRVTFGATPMVARRVAQSEATVESFVPQACAQAVGGCMGLQALLQRGAPTATCAAGAMGGCDCRATASFTIDDGDAYRTEGNEIVSATSGKRWEYCVEGEGLRYRDTSPSGMREPGSISLRRR